MHTRCAAVVALFASCAALLSACGQSNQGTVSAADNLPAPGWTSSVSGAAHVRPLRDAARDAMRDTSAVHLDSRTELRNAVGTPTPFPTLTVTVTVTPVPTATDTFTENPDCNWMWAYQELPEITIQVSSALDAAGIAYSNVSAQTLGENCLDLEGQTQYFTPMETDYEITVLVRSLTDRKTLGDQAAAVLFLLNTSFPPDSTPGPIAGQIKLTFAANGETLRLVIRQEDAEQVLSADLSGGAVLDALDH